MRRFISLMGMSALCLGTGLAQAGVGSSGGGAAVVCRNAEGRLLAAQLLDLYEAKVLNGFSPVSATGSVDRDYYLAAANTYRLQGYPEVGPMERERISENLQRFFDLVRMTPPGVKLPHLPDLGSVPALPQGCAIEQLAIFHDDEPNSVEIDSEIWNALDSLNRAALVTHELAYAWQRQLQERTSETTRSFVAHVYAAPGQVVPVREGVPEARLRCWSEDFAYRESETNEDGSVSSSNTHLSGFEAYPIQTADGPGTRLQFNAIAGRPSVARATIDLRGVGLKLKNTLDRSSFGQMIAIVEEPGKDLRIERPLSGTFWKDWSVEVVYRTGAPMKLVFKKNGVRLAEDVVTNCR